MNSTYDIDGYSGWIDAYAASTTSTYGYTVNYGQAWRTGYPGTAVSNNWFTRSFNVSPSEEEKDVGFAEFEEVLEDAS